MKNTQQYVSAFTKRYASQEMQYLFSQHKKYSTWRKLWIALAETEMELGLSENGRPVVTKQMIDEMKEYTRAFMQTEADGFTNLTKGDAFYWPMVSLVQYLTDNDFRVNK